MEKIEVKIKTFDQSSVEIRITGDVSLKYIEKFYTDLKGIKDSYKVYKIFFSEVENIDAAGFQILYSYFKFLQKKKKKISIEDQFPEELANLLNCVGVLDILYLKKQ